MLSTLGKKILLSIHILLIAMWIGTLFATMLVLLLKHNTFNVVQFGSVDKAIFLLFDSIIINISIAVAISGLVFSLFTTWGFFRFYWVITKWITIIVLAIIIMFWASPAVNGMAALSDSLSIKVLTHPDYIDSEHQYILFAVVQLILLIFIIFISVIKPWGQRKAKKVNRRKIVVTTGLVTGGLLVVSSIMQYTQLEHYRNMPITEINLNQINDGYYSGRADYGFEYLVGVEIRNNSIKTIDILKNRDSFYARQAEGIKYKVLLEQKINMDGLTGATTTSKILLKAMENALLNGQD